MRPAPRRTAASANAPAADFVERLAEVLGICGAWRGRATAAHRAPWPEVARPRRRRIGSVRGLARPVTSRLLSVRAAGGARRTSSAGPATDAIRAVRERGATLFELAHRFGLSERRAAMTVTAARGELARAA